MLQTQTFAANLIIQTGLGIAIGFILKHATYALGLHLSHNVAYNALANMRRQMSDKIMKVSLGTIEAEGQGGLKKLFVEGIEDMELILAHGAPEGIANTLGVIILLITLFAIDWRLGLVLLMTVVIGFFILTGTIKKGYALIRPYYAAAAQMNDTLIDYINGMDVVKVFNRTHGTFEKFVNAVTYYRDFTFKWTEASIKGMTAYISIFTTPLILMLPVGLILIFNQIITIDAFVFACLVAMSIGTSLTRMVTFFPSVAQISEKSRRIFRFLDLPELKTPSQPRRPETFDVSFDDVHFKYNPEAREETIDGVSFTTPNNTITALVGESGSGKSTLVKLLLRFWDYDVGEIRIGGIPIKEINIPELMKITSYVSQDNYLFNMTIRENLLIGNPDATEEQLIAALKAANAYDFVMHEQQGLDTLTGPGGAKLSGGEIQRIAIARAILKNAPILILDEATSFTDPENEELIQAGLNRLMGGKTVFVIAHRLSTIERCDQIVLLDEGKVVGLGTHDQLIATSPLYKQLYSLSTRSLNWEIGGQNHV